MCIHEYIPVFIVDQIPAILRSFKFSSHSHSFLNHATYIPRWNLTRWGNSFVYCVDDGEVLSRGTISKHMASVIQELSCGENDVTLYQIYIYF